MKAKVLSPLIYRGQRLPIGAVADIDADVAEGLLNADPPPIEPAAPSALPGPTHDDDDQIYESKPIEDPEMNLEGAPAGAEDPAELSPGVPPEIPAKGPEENPEENPEESSGDELVSVNAAPLDLLIETFKKVKGIGEGSARAVVENRPYQTLGEVPDKADLVGTARNKWPDISEYLKL